MGDISQLGREMSARINTKTEKIDPRYRKTKIKSIKNVYTVKIQFLDPIWRLYTTEKHVWEER